MQRLTIRLKLLPDPVTRERFLAKIAAINDCCNWIAAEAWLAQTFRRFDLHHLVYRRGRESYELGADAMCGAIGKVATVLARPVSRAPRFKPHGAVKCNARDFRIAGDTARLAMGGKPFISRFACRPSDRALLMDCREAKIGLSLDGKLFMDITVEIETPEATATDAIGVDLGVANIATDSNDTRYSGAELRGVRSRRRRLRAKLQSRGTRSAKRRLKRLRRREARFARDINHCISKKLVAEAERTKAAIALEELTHIRRRIRVSGKQQRATLSSWSFGQLRQFVTYKAALAGVPLILVDPRNTSRECSACGHIDKRNRPNQATFKCRVCGFAAHADYNAALVIRDRGRAALSQPYATNASHLVASPSGSVERDNSSTVG